MVGMLLSKVVVDVYSRFYRWTLECIVNILFWGLTDLSDCLRSRKRILVSGLMFGYAVSFHSGLCFLQERFPSPTSVHMAPSSDTLLITTIASCTRGECLILNAGMCESLVTVSTWSLIRVWQRPVWKINQTECFCCSC